MKRPRHERRRIRGARRLARRAVIGAPLAALMFAQLAAAQQEGPIIYGQQEKHDWLSLDPPHAAVEVKYRRESDVTESDDGQETEFTEERFEETLELWTLGSIYHPNFVELDLAGTFGLAQVDLDSDVGQDRGDDEIYEWDTSATFLRKETDVLTLYSRRNRQLITRQFGPSLESTITTNGAILDMRNKTVPTRLEVFHSDQVQDSLDDVGDLSLSQDAFIWHSDWRPSLNQAWAWDYSYNAVDQETEGFEPTSFDTHDAALSHSIDFGPKDKHNLSSSLTYFEQAGDFPFDRLRWNELLRLRHDDTFETRYQYTLDDQTVSGIDQTQQTAMTGFTHRLYKSLVTTGSVGIQDLARSDGADSFETFADLDFDYLKKVPYGRFTANMGFGYSHQENDARDEITQIVNDLRTFNNGFPIVLTGANVIPGSIVITDPSGLILLQPGLDYRIDTFPDRVEIDRIIGGSIGSGDSVLIDYQLAPQGANVTTTDTFNLGGRYDIQEGPLAGLSLFARYARQDQNIDSDNPDEFIPNSFTDVVYGAEYQFWEFLVGAEQQLHDSTIAPFDATRLYGRWVRPVSLDTTVSLNTAFTTVDYTDTDNRIELWTISGQVHHRFSRKLSVLATVLWRDERDDLRGHTEGWEQQLELRWNHRQTHVYALIRNSMLETETQDNTFQFIEIGLRREF